MKRIGNLLLLLFFICTGLWYYRRYKERLLEDKELKEKLAKEQEENKKKLNDFYQERLKAMKKAVNAFGKYIDHRTGYFSNYQLTSWIKLYDYLYDEIKNVGYEGIELEIEDVHSIRMFNDYFVNAKQYRNNYNEKFVKEELVKFKGLFDSVEGRTLDLQQRTAIVIDDDNSIVIAGAGSGKTTTIVGKTNYVLSRYNVPPGKILLISFTNKSVSTLVKRINSEGLVAKTFHKFGIDIIAEVDGKQPSIFDERQFKPLLTRIFTELIGNSFYLEKVTDYFINFLKPVKSQFEYDNQGDYIQYIKDQNFRTYKLREVPTNGRTTYKTEVVKSIEECKIANFLLFNGINYEYEYPYEYETADQNYRQYKPDFTVIQDGKKTYIEHLAVSRNGNVPPFFAKNLESPEDAKNRYWQKIEWARDLHMRYNTTLLETYSYEMNENILFENLTKNLIDKGIRLEPKSPQEIWRIISNTAKDEVTGLINVFSTFITLMKSNNYTLTDIVNRNKNIKDAFIKKRNAKFIEIIKPIYEEYEKHLTGRDEIDFNDMINRATEYIRAGQYKKTYSYVIVDEFQDISIGRYQLLKALKEKTPSCKLFCVGDDWQSIYRFAGSDIALFKEFEKYFGFTVKSKIETTYRFNNPLIELSSYFILKNPNQTPKQLKGTADNRTTDYRICYSVSDNQDDTYALKEILDELFYQYPVLETKEILILGRYSFDIDRIKNEERIFSIDRENDIISYTPATALGSGRSIKAQYLTVHKAKGLEADIVIVINCNAGKYGFPSEMSDDPVLNLLLSEADQFENGEERRLFYVALTRAKERIYLIADSSFKSKFVTELELESGSSPNKKCPICKTADLVLRKSGKARTGSAYKFYGCTNYLYGCEYTTTEWEN